MALRIVEIHTVGITGGHSFEEAVDDGYNFCTRNKSVGTETAVLIARYDTCGYCVKNSLSVWSVGCHVGKGCELYGSFSLREL